MYKNFTDFIVKGLLFHMRVSVYFTSAQRVHTKHQMAKLITADGKEIEGLRVKNRSLAHSLLQ